MTPAAPEPPPPGPGSAAPEPPEWAFIRAEVEALRRRGVRLFVLSLDKDGVPSLRAAGPERKVGAMAVRAEGS